MSNHLRHDKECQNCGYTVDVAYCSKCGQKNTETRQSFWHLVTHFAEDLTHYDSGFWKTIKYLLFRPGKLTVEYLQGHRQKFVPPVKLYIFISFLTFFILAILPYNPNDTEAEAKPKTEVEKSNVTVVDAERTVKYDNVQIKNMKDLEAAYAKEQIPAAFYYIQKAVYKADETDITYEEFIDHIIHLIPKVLFIYMPFFTFWLWLFHGKKRWYFFDHGIFTLHYFSFLLLLTLINTTLEYGASYLHDALYTIINFITGIIGIGYSFFYFFRSHRIMYGERKTISRLKSLCIFVINMICVSITIVAASIYVILTIDSH